MSSSDPKWHNSSAGCRGLVMTEEALSNGASELETAMEDHSVGGGGDHLALGSDGMSEISNSDLSLPEICISTNSNSFDEDMNYELQQAYRIFTGFLLDKHKGITSPFLQPIGHLEAQHGIGGVRGRGQAQLRQSMCLQRMEEKFANQEYETIAEFVADFRLMLENCYRYHGVDHWISKQAQKLEIMLEQKLMLLSRTLREKTTLAVTSKGRFSAEEERGSGGSSTRRRSAPRSLATLTVGGHESIMVQALRLEEQQRIKEEKRQRELEKKEAEETSAKEVEEWEQSLLLQASPHPVDTLWELPAIGHFLCLAQTALNLPEIVFYELERCLLMPCSSIFLSKIMSSLLCSSQKRTTLQRRPALPYRCWEKDLRRRVLGWYQAVGACRDQPSRAEQLGLCHQFFTVVGEVSPLEETPFHLLSFYQRVWLLKGLCDNVYETQKHVQDAVLAQPIHECRESILGYDGVENAYIHFPHFCGADLRIYCQSPSMPPAFPFPPVWVKKVEIQPGNDESDATENVKDTNEKGCSVTGDSEDSGNEKEEKHTHFKMENWGKEAKSERFNSMFLKEESSDSVSSDADDTSEDSKPDVKVHADSSSLNLGSAAGRTAEKTSKKTPFELELRPTCSHRLTTAQELDSSLGLERTIKAETQDPCLSVGEHSYTGRSPVCTMSLVSPAGVPEVKVEGGAPTEVRRASCLECSRSNTGDVKSEPRNCHCHPSGIAATSSPERMQNLGKERMKNRIRAKRKKRKKSCESEQLLGVKVEPSQLRRLERTRKCQAQAAKTAAEQAAFPVKTNKRKKIKPGEKEKRLDSSKKIKEEPKVKPAFKLVCISLQELRELISKTEDELDELESTKKRSGRWYFKKEAVKDLHITLIRLLNELSPWEPKLVKAYQRNRLRLKKEFDDSKKHPDGNNFVSDECVSTSSEDEGRLLGRGVCSPPDHYRACEEEDLEHAVPRGLWTGGSSRQLVAESIGCNVTYKNSYHLKHLLSTNVDVILQREQMVSGSLTSSPVCELESSSNPVITAQSRDLNLAFEAVTPAHASSRGRPPILSPTTGLPKGYTPIPTLLAKSVGNKVTLMKRPDDYQGLSHLDGQIKGQMCSTPLSAVVSTKRSQAQRTPSEPQQTLQETCTEGSDQPKEDLKSVASITTTATTAAPPKPLQTKLTPPMAVPKSTVKVVYKVPVGLDHLLKKDATNPVKITVQPLVDQNTGEKIMKQVVILPPNLLLQKNNEICFQHQPHQSDVASPLCMSSSVPGFTIPDGSIQQVASLNDARTVMTPSPALSPCLQQSTVSMKDLKLAQACSSQAITPKSVIQNQLPIPSTTAVLTDSTKLTDPKQELKTVCVRDSQSILVTTRGGNTGIVKIQTSSEQSVRGSLPASPVITISPQFKAFLVSQSTSTQTTSCPASTTTSILTAQLQKQCPSAATAPLLTSVPASYTTGTAVTLSKGDVSPVSSLPAKSGPNAQTIDATQTQTSPLKSSMIVPPLTCSVTHIPSQAQLINNCGVKRANSDEGSQFTKYILVTPSSPSSLSNAAAPKVTSSLNAPTPLSRVLFIDESAAASSTTTSIGSLPKQVPVTGINQPPLTTALSSEVLKMSLSLGQPLDSIKSEALSKIKNFAPPSGVQIHLPGQVTNLGQSIDSVLHSSKSTSAAISTGLVFLKSSDMLTSSPAHLASTLTTSSQHKGLSSISTETPRCTSTVVTPSSRCIFTKGMDLAKGLPTNKSVAHIPAMGQHSQSNTTPVTLAHQSQNVLTAVTTLSPVVMSPHTSTSVANPNSIARSTNSLITTTPTLTTTATAGTIQQRIVINTSSRLAAGTQILLNNTRFVVPPQGLGPGSHVLIISSHGPQQVPSANNPPYSAAAQAPGPSQVSAMLKPTALPGLSPLKLHSLPTLSSPIAVHKPVGGSSLLATMPNVGQVRLAGAHVMESSFPSSTTKMSSSLPRLQGAQDRGSSVVGGQSLASSPIRLGGTQALVSAVITKASTCSSALHNTGLSPGTLSRCPPHLSTLSPSPNLPRFPIPLSSRVNASPSAVSLTDSIIGTQSPLTSVVAQSTAVFSGTPCLSSAPLAQPGESGPGSPPQQIALGNPAPCTLASTIPQATPQTGIINPSIKQQLTAMQPQQRSTQSQVLQAVAAPRIVNTLPRMQSLPVATVQPAGGAISSFQVSPLANHFPSSSTVKQIISLKISETVHPPVPTNPEWGKANLQTVSTAGHTNIASKLLVSPDGAVLNTIQGPVHQASLPTCSKQLSRLVILPSGALSTHHPMNSSAQLTKADTGKP